jgi:hypothetical protein
MGSAEQIHTRQGTNRPQVDSLICGGNCVRIYAGSQPDGPFIRWIHTFSRTGSGCGDAGTERRGGALADRHDNVRWENR